MLATMAVGRPMRPAALFSVASPQRFRFLRRLGPSASAPAMKVRGKTKGNKWGRWRRTLGAAASLHIAIALPLAVSIAEGARRRHGADLAFATLAAGKSASLSQGDVVRPGDALVAPRHVGWFSGSTSMGRWKVVIDDDGSKFRFQLWNGKTKGGLARPPPAAAPH
jgi:hypothetical protein